MRWPALASTGVALLAIVMMTTPARGQGPWRVSVDGRDVTGAADPRQRGGALLVDASALAPRLSCWLEQGTQQFTLRGPTGEWQGRSGQPWLEALGRRLDLAVPPLREGAALFLPVEALATACGQPISMDEARGEVGLGRRPPTPADPEVAEAEGWEAFSLPKTRAELQAQADLYAAGPAEGGSHPPLLPPARGQVRAVVGLGYVQGADFGGDAAANGTFKDLELQADGQFSRGRSGFELPAFRLGLREPRRRLGLEVGDLSGLWGLSRGVRLSWGPPSGGLALGAAWARSRATAGLAGGIAGPSGALLDARIPLLGHGELLGALGSDRTGSASGQLRVGPVGTSGFWRRSGSDPAGNAVGGFASLSLPGGIGLQGGLSATGSGPAATRTRGLSLRAPLPRKTSLSLESTTASGMSARDSLTGRFYLSLGNSRGMLGYRTTRSAAAAWEPELQASWGASLGRHLRYDLQIIHRLGDRGGPATWRQLTLGFRPTASTSIELVSDFPQAYALDRVRLRATQRLGKKLAFGVEYGSVSPYQSATVTTSSPQWRVLLRRELALSTPAGGSSVEGTVRDERGQPVADAAVRLGPYRTFSGQDGRWRLAHVPPVEHDLWLEQEALPLGLSGEEARRTVRAGSSEVAPAFKVSRLARVTGAVFVDRDRDGQRGPGEGRAGVLVTLDERTTVTEPSGGFAFHDVAPGRHRLSITPERIGARLSVPEGSSREIDVVPGKPASHELRLVERAVEIIFQEQP